MCDQLNDDFLREDCHDFYTCVFVIATSDLEVEFGSRIKVQEEITSPEMAIVMQTWRFCHVQFLYGVTCMCIHNYRIIAYSPPTSTHPATDHPHFTVSTAEGPVIRYLRALVVLHRWSNAQSAVVVDYRHGAQIERQPEK